MGVFLYFFSHKTTSSAFLPPSPHQKRVILWCSWCKSPAQTTQACQQSAADSSNPLFTVVLSQASLSQGSGSHQLHSKRPLNPLWTGPEHLHYVPSKRIAYITVHRGGPYACLISPGYQEVLPERKARKESISVKRQICIHLLIFCFYGETSLLSSRISLFLSFSFQTLIFTFHILGLWSVLCGAHHHASRFAQPAATIIIINQNTVQGIAARQTSSHSFF